MNIVLVTLVLVLAQVGGAYAAEGAPEIDPTTASAGITLAVGAVLLYLERRRRR
jgi:uncharacterized protein (TIGR03382 family)